MPEFNQDHIKQLLGNYLQEKNPNLSDFDKQDFNDLLQDSLGGVDSAQYLTGRKKNEVETFYDKHPVQATIHDTLNKAPLLAGGLIAGQVGHSVLKDYLLNRKINAATKGFKDKPGLQGLTGKSYEDSPDLQRVFPKAVDKWETEKGEQKSKFNPGNDPGVYGDTYQKINAGKSDLQKPNARGYTANLLGLEGRKDERLTRIMSQHFPKDTIEHGGHADAEHLSGMAKELGGVNRSRAGRIGEATAKRISDPYMGMKNLASHVNPRLAGGALAVGAGGMALAPMVSYLQKNIYGQPQVHEWMKNKRMTEGRFDE